MYSTIMFNAQITSKKLNVEACEMYVANFSMLVTPLAIDFAKYFLIPPPFTPGWLINMGLYLIAIIFGFKMVNTDFTY